MRIRHADRDLERLETAAGYLGGFSRDVVRAYLKVMLFIRNAPDERALYGMKSLHYEKLKGNRAHQRSLRLTDEGGRTIVVVAVEDYHQDQRCRYEQVIQTRRSVPPR